MTETPHPIQKGEVRRLLRYVAPYVAPLSAGILLLAVMAALEACINLYVSASDINHQHFPRCLM